jgi:Protein of unknown function (DUF1353)
MRGWLLAILAAGLLGRASPLTAAPVVIEQAQPSGLAVVIIRDGRRDDDRRIAVLTEPWLYCSPVNRSLYVVPAGYVTDFASVPRAAKLFYTQFGDWVEASVIHDWLYDVGQEGHKDEADRIFREALKEQGVGGFSRTVMFLAVRAGGGRAYRQAEKRRPEDWAAHFVDRRGEQLPAPPFPQPLDPVWRRDVDCAEIEDATTVKALLREYQEETGRNVLLR